MMSRKTLLRKGPKPLSNIILLEKLWRMSFKQFLMVSQRTTSDMIHKMINRDLTETAERVTNISEAKWEARRNYSALGRRPRPDKKSNLIKGFPNTWCQLLSMTCRPCPRCNTKGIITSVYHLREEHGIHIKSPLEVWEDIKQVIDKKDKRPQINEKAKPIIEANVNIYIRPFYVCDL